MSRLAYPFWNRAERRLRAFWRLVLQALLLVVAPLVLLPLYPLIAATPYEDQLIGIIVPLLMIATVWAAGRLLDRRPLVDLGLRIDRAWWLDCVFGLVLGVLTMGLVFLIANAAGWIECRVTPGLTFSDHAAWLLWGLVEFAFVAVGEELFSRGYHLRNLAEGLHGRLMGARVALVASVTLSSAVFAALHLPANDATVLSAANTFLAGVLLAVPVVYTGRLGLAIGLHLTWNFAQGNLFGFPVSGNTPRTALLTIDEHGPATWTGGTYGPEGGLLATGAFLLAIVVTLIWIRRRHGPLQLATTLTEYAGSRPSAQTELSAHQQVEAGGGESGSAADLELPPRREK